MESVPIEDNAQGIHLSEKGHAKELDGQSEVAAPVAPKIMTTSDKEKMDK